MHTHSYHKGLVLTFLGVLILSADALLVRMAATNGLTAAFWRGSFAFLSLFTLLLLTKRKEALTVVLSGGFPLVVSALLWGLSGVTFSLGVSRAGAPTTLVMMSLSPLFAAAYSSVVQKEKPAGTTIAATIGSCMGILYMFHSQLGDGLSKDLAFALGTPLFLGVNLAHLRKHKDLNRIAVCMLGGLSGAIISFLALNGAIAIPSASLLPLLLLGLFVVPIAQTMISEGTKYLKAAQAALITSLETVFGIIYVWVFLNEHPSMDFLVGGGFVMLCISANSILQGKQQTGRARMPSLNHTQK